MGRRVLQSRHQVLHFSTFPRSFSPALLGRKPLLPVYHNLCQTGTEALLLPPKPKPTATDKQPTNASGQATGFSWNRGEELFKEAEVSRHFWPNKKNRWFSRNAFVYSRGLQTFLSEGHISYFTTIRGPDILRNVAFSGFVTFCAINKFFWMYSFFIIEKMSLRLDEMVSQAGWDGVSGWIRPAGRSLQTPDMWRYIFESSNETFVKWAEEPHLTYSACAPTITCV